MNRTLQLNNSMDIYYRRVRGEQDIWSASTRCIKCDKWYMWGLEDNLVFTCDNCKKHE